MNSRLGKAVRTICDVWTGGINKNVDGGHSDHLLVLGERKGTAAALVGLGF